MAALDMIPKLDAAGLAVLRGNAERWTLNGTEQQKSEAESVLLAIEVEERRRKEELARGWEREKTAIADRFRDRGLHDRVVAAFMEKPPAHWEAEVLRAIAANPGSGFETLAQAIGKRAGSYINLAVGSLCAAREPWLGTAPPAQDDPSTKVYSALIIDFTRHETPVGGAWHGWTLKPEAKSGLRQAGIL